MKIKRHYPIGAEIFPNKGVDFRVWAPDYQKVSLVFENQSKGLPMKREKDGYFSIFVPNVEEGSLYWFKLGTREKLMTDPASRYQPLGVFGPSCVINPKYEWTDDNWKGIEIKGQIIYEMHIGTFTPEGTFNAAAEQLEELAKLGITAIELMPLNEFYGHFGWGYDGVNLFAPTHLYGTPNQLKNFINQAHKFGLAVIHDVVYNHLGPEGNLMFNFSKDYVNKKLENEWGDPINFDSPQVREYFLTNARYWIQEYHFDGLRIDATPYFFCSTPVHILSELTKVTKKAGGKRKTIIIGENEPQNTNLIRPFEEGGNNFDALWNDDFHHSAHVRLTGKREAYYTDYLGSSQEFISSLKYGFLYQGQYYAWQKKPRGVPHLNIPFESMILFIENHDQIANSGLGLRLHQLSDPGNYKALTAVLLLGPNIPMLFQGQEFGSTSPFFYFADHSENLSKLVLAGRKNNLAQFPRLAIREIYEQLPNPEDPITFMKCKLNFNERIENAALYALHKDLIKLRKTDLVFKDMTNVIIDGAVLSSDVFIIRYFGEDKGDRLLIINFGPDLYYSPSPEPLIVAGLNLKWKIIWSSESTKYGGEGTPPINIPFLKVLGHSAIVLKTVAVSQNKKAASL